LSWAAGEQRILSTHDLKTIPHFARKRISEGKSMAGVIWLAQSTPIGLAIEDILTIVEATEPEGRIGLSICPCDEGVTV